MLELLRDTSCNVRTSCLHLATFVESNWVAMIIFSDTRNIGAPGD